MEISKIQLILHYLSLSLRKKCPYAELFWSLFSRIRTEYGEIQRISPYSVQMRENVDQNNSEYWQFSPSVYLSQIRDLPTNLFKSYIVPQTNSKGISYSIFDIFETSTHESFCLYNMVTFTFTVWFWTTMCVIDEIIFRKAQKSQKNFKDQPNNFISNLNASFGIFCLHH